MSDVDQQVRQILLVMGVCSGVAQAFVVEATKRGWDVPDPERTAEAFSVAGPMMLTGLPERELVEKLETLSPISSFRLWLTVRIPSLMESPIPAAPRDCRPGSIITSTVATRSYPKTATFWS